MRESTRVRYALLALLSAGPRYGLQLCEESGLNPDLVYPALQRLERDGLVESGGTGPDLPHRGFRIAAGGKRELARWLRAPADRAGRPHDELAMKILVAARVPGTDAHQVVQGHRRYLLELMQRWTRVKEDQADHDLGLALMIEAELFRLDSVVRWLDAADNRLERTAGPQRPVPPALPRLRVRVAPPGGPDHGGVSTAADDHMRTSDADRESVTAQLRDHFAEGRLTREEFGERVAAALHARTFGELRGVLSDLPYRG